MDCKTSNPVFVCAGLVWPKESSEHMVRKIKKNLLSNSSLPVMQIQRKLWVIVLHVDDLIIIRDDVDEA